MDALEILRDATRGTEYEGKLFLVGGYVRDKLLGRPQGAGLDDIDLVLEGDAIAVAWLLYRRRASWHKPTVFETFGTAMVHVGGTGKDDPGDQVELVTARSETYRQGSRKPVVTPGTLQTDAERRDFTVNTFLENLHTGEVVDPLGRARADLAAGVLRTPLDPVVTFTDDPLRMLRACRFAAKLGFSVAPETYEAVRANAFRCTPEHGISFERVRDELNKTLLTSRASLGLEMMRDTGLLDRFAPELSAMHGVTQNRFHRYDVWRHTLVALDNLPSDADLLLRLAVLFHDSGKPRTRTEDAEGNVHFYGHEDVGAEIAREVMTRLRYSTDEVARVVRLVALHMRYGAYKPDEWTDASVRRLIRTVGEHRGYLFTLARADIAACNTDDYPTADLEGLRERMEEIESVAHVTQATSPLSGQEIMEMLGLKPGRAVGKIKDALTDAVVAGELAPDDREGALERARALLTTELSVPAAG
jgi:poly(A) polymerase